MPDISRYWHIQRWVINQTIVSYQCWISQFWSWYFGYVRGYIHLVLSNGLPKYLEEKDIMKSSLTYSQMFSWKNMAWILYICQNYIKIKIMQEVMFSHFLDQLLLPAAKTIHPKPILQKAALSSVFQPGIRCFKLLTTALPAPSLSVSSWKTRGELLPNDVIPLRSHILQYAS